MDSNEIKIIIFPISPYYLLCPLISFISALAVIILSILTGYHKEPLRKMVIIILILDFIYCLPALIAGHPYPKSDALCKLFGVILHFGFEGSCVYSALFANAMLTVIKELDSLAIQKKMRWYFFWGIIVPLLHSLSSVFMKYVQYSSDYKQCVHIATPGKIDTSYIFITSLPIAVCCMLSLFWYALTARQLRTIVTEARNRDLMVLLLYPAIMIVCWGPNLILDALITFGHSPSSLWTNLFFQGLCRLQGFLNAIVYGCSGKMMLEIGKLKCCRCLCNNRNHQLYYSNIETGLQFPQEGRQYANSEYSFQRSQSSEQIATLGDRNITSLLQLGAPIK